MVEPNLQRSEIDRARKRTASLDAYDLYLRALPHTTARMPAGTSIALPLLEQALKLDPDYPAAHELAAWCYEWRFTRGGFAEENRKSALSHAEAVIAGDTDDAAALAVAGFVTSILSAESGFGLDAVKRALWLNGSSATVLFLASHAHAIADENEAAKSIADRALRLSPFDPFAFEANMALGDVAMREERYDDATACFAPSAGKNPAYSTAHFFRGMAAALAGRIDDAGPMVRRGLALETEFRARIVFEVVMTPAMTGRFVEGARRLGLKV
jgi:adenylate cyclase